MPFSKKLIFTFTLSLCFDFSYSQITSFECGTYQAMKELNINSQITGTPNVAFPRTTFTIPTVFHILTNEASDDLSLPEVQATIDFLNARLRAELESSAPNINSTFAALATGTDIQLALAGKDPEGNCSNGITKTETDSSKFFNLNDPKFERSGGKNGWDARRYLNIWIVPDYVVVGSASFPNNLVVEDGFDGVVIRRDRVMDAVLVHELGHWFNLPHIWGNNDVCCVPENCNLDDGFADTPNTIGHLVTPSNDATCGTPDNLQNYMDFTTERLMFTPDQVTAMQAALNSSLGYRNELWTTDNLRSTGIIENEPCTHLLEFFSEKWEYIVNPNPFFNELTLEVRSFEDKPYVVRLFDTSGRLLLENTFSMIGKQIMSVPNLNTGVYFLEFDNGEEKVIRKVVKI